MQVKKNPKADLNRSTGLFFQIGLVLVLLVTWRALEYKSFDVNEEIVQLIELEDDLKEDVPMTEMIKAPPPPPPPSAPELIEIVEDEAEIEETIIESSEMNQETVIDTAIDVDDVEVGEEEEEVSVPFAVIENVPIFPGCEKLTTNDEKRACFSQKMQEHVKKHFRYPDTALELGIQGRVHVQFKINREGNISDIRMRGPDSNLEKEAARIIAALPRMTPGKQRGRNVTVPYSIPINFVLK